MFLHACTVIGKLVEYLIIVILVNNINNLRSKHIYGTVRYGTVRTKVVFLSFQNYGVHDGDQDKGCHFIPTSDNGSASSTSCKDTDDDDEWWECLGIAGNCTLPPVPVPVPVPIIMVILRTDSTAELTIRVPAIDRYVREVG